MSARRPMPIAQPGMTAWGRAAERELDAYGRTTALAAPDDLTERVMVAIEIEAPTRRHAVPRWLPPVGGRLRLAGGVLAVILTMTAGAALAVAGASAIIRHDTTPPTFQGPQDQPIVVAQPTRSPAVDTREPTPEPRGTVAAPVPPKPNEHEAVEATDPPRDREATEPDPTEDADETDDPDATDDPDDGDQGRDGPDETEDPDEGGSSGGSGEGGG